MISISLFCSWSSSTNRSRLRSRHPAAAARHPAACQFCVSRLISVNSAALKSAAAITRCPSSTVRTLPCGGGCAASLHAPPRPDPRTPRFPPLLLRARAAACIMPNLFVNLQQPISCRRDPLRLRQAVLSEDTAGSKNAAPWPISTRPRCRRRLPQQPVPRQSTMRCSRWRRACGM